MRKGLKIDEDKLMLLDVDNYGSDITIGGMNLVDEILFWLEHEGFRDEDGKLVRPLKAKFAIEVTDGA